MGKLTVRGIENAKAKEKPYKLVDGDGLQLRVATDGVKTWLVRYVVDGTERQYRLPQLYRSSGGEGFCSLQDAREEAAKIRALARQGIDYAISLKQELEAQEQKRQAELKQKAEEAEAIKANNLTIQNLFEVWLADGVRRKDGNAELRRSFRADLLPLVGDISIQKISEHDLRNALRQMVARGVDRAAVVMRNNLTQMFAWAEKRQPWRRLLVDGNPMDLIEIEKIVSPDFDMNSQRTRTLNPDELRELRATFDRMQKEYEEASDRRAAPRPMERSVQCALWIMLSTLCRVGETSMARWEHVDFVAGTWFIPKSNVKDNVADHLVFLSEFALRQFRNLHGITGFSEWCFPAKNKGGHVCEKSISKQTGDRQSMFKTDKHGNPRQPMKHRRHDNSLVLGGGENGKWTPHDLRRTGATLMQKLKVPLDTIDRCQNHVLAGSKVRRHYLLHDYAEEKKEAWVALGNYLQTILGAPGEGIEESLDV
jgi:integrase